MLDSWTLLAPYPGDKTPVGIMAAVFNGKMYTFLAKDTYEYNPRTNVWTKKTAVPTSKSG